MDIFAGIAITLYIGHHIGDYWVQSDHDAAHKGKAGPEGVYACLRHVFSYVITQGVCVLLLSLATGEFIAPWLYAVSLIVSGVFHYAADRREFGIMFRLARLIPGKAKFLTLGVPRGGHYDDNPSLGTGAWALDQSWHIATSVFLPALIVAAFS
jgi:hypothetical protein